MKKLGLVGGISWVSTIDYYRYINEGINERLGGLNYAECITYSVNFQHVHDNNSVDDWDANFRLLSSACDSLKKAGAEGIVLCANTAHLIADRIQEYIQLPLIHIAVSTADAVRQQGLKKIGLLGTQFTMERRFFKDKLSEKGIETIVPSQEERAYIVKTLDEELHKGILTESTKKGYLEIIDNLLHAGAEGIILGCTEIPMLIKTEEIAAPAFDTTKIHAQAAVDFALG
ncbi:MAG: aspartate/glutamate racemase family protein [Chitinophagaceae bacterium]